MTEFIAPPERELPDGRHRLLREQLMSQIRTEKPNVRVRVAIVAGISAAIVAAAGGAVVATQTIASAPTTQSMSAGDLLMRIAAATEKLPVDNVRNGQWVYVKSISRVSDLQPPSPARPAMPITLPDGRRETVPAQPATPGKPGKLGPPRQREFWSPVGNDVSVRAMYREDGRDTEVEWAPGSQILLAQQGSYRAIESLPTDPTALLKLIYDDVRAGHPGAAASLIDRYAFGEIGSIIQESIVPPRVRAALYRAAAKIHGVQTVPDATDAAGRHGIGVTLRDQESPVVSAWIFEKKTFTYLGSSSVLAHDSAAGKAGTLVSNTAVLGRAIVDKRGQLPTG